MPVPTTIADLSTTASNNSPAATDAVSNGDDYLRAIQAILRTTYDDLSEQVGGVITPEQYGAVGNGTSDDTTAFASFLTACAANKGVLRPGKTYLLSTWTAHSNSSILRIEGNGATVKGPSSTVDFLSPAAGVYINNVRFDRWNSVVERLLASSGTIAALSLTDCAFLNCNGQVINIERPLNTYWIDRCVFDTCSGGYCIKIGENTYANQDLYVKGVISNNTFSTLTAGSTTSCAAMLVYGREVTICNNKIDGVNQTGTGEAWGIYTKVRYGQVYGNYVNNVVADGSTDNVGINIKGSPRGLTSSPQGFSNSVWGNHVRNIGVAGTQGYGIRAQTDDVLVYGNLVEDPGLAGLVTDDSNANANNVFMLNTVRYASTVAGTYGCRLENNADRCGFERNTVINAETGIIVFSHTSGSNDDHFIVNNTFTGTTTGIAFTAQSGGTLNRMRIDGNVVTGGTYGILNNSGPGTVSNLRVRDNDTAAATNPVAGSLGTSCVADGNIGFLSASATWDPGSIANGASSSATMTIVGAELGDAVVGSFSLALGNMGITASVTQADQVEVRLMNNSGGAVDLGSGTVRARVIKGIA